MTAVPISAITMVCDGCGREDIELDNDNPTYFPDRAAAAHWMAGSGWEIPTNTTTGPDLCPRCVCARAGHEWHPVDGVRGINAYCPRCQSYRRVTSGGAR